MKALEKDIDERKDKEYCRETYYSCVLYHLLLIVINYSFHPQSGLKGKEQIREFKKLLKQPMFDTALKHIHFEDFFQDAANNSGMYKVSFLLRRKNDSKNSDINSLKTIRKDRK